MIRFLSFYELQIRISSLMFENWKFCAKNSFSFKNSKMMKIQLHLERTSQQSITRCRLCNSWTQLVHPRKNSMRLPHLHRLAGRESAIASWILELYRSTIGRISGPRLPCSRTDVRSSSNSAERRNLRNNEKFDEGKKERETGWRQSNTVEWELKNSVIN